MHFIKKVQLSGIGAFTNALHIWKFYITQSKYPHLHPFGLSQLHNETVNILAIFLSAERREESLVSEWTEIEERNHSQQTLFINLAHFHHNISKEILTISSLTTSSLSMTPVERSCERVSKALLRTDRVACLVLTEIAMPGCSRCSKPINGIHETDQVRKNKYQRLTSL